MLAIIDPRRVYPKAATVLDGLLEARSVSINVRTLSGVTRRTGARVERRGCSAGSLSIEPFERSRWRLRRTRRISMGVESVRGPVRTRGVRTFLMSDCRTMRSSARRRTAGAAASIVPDRLRDAAGTRVLAGVGSAGATGADAVCRSRRVQSESFDPDVDGELASGESFDGDHHSTAAGHGGKDTRVDASTTDAHRQWIRRRARAGSVAGPRCDGEARKP